MTIIAAALLGLGAGFLFVGGRDVDADAFWCGLGLLLLSAIVWWAALS